MEPKLYPISEPIPTPPPAPKKKRKTRTKKVIPGFFIKQGPFLVAFD